MFFSYDMFFRHLLMFLFLQRSLFKKNVGKRRKNGIHILQVRLINSIGVLIQYRGARMMGPSLKSQVLRHLDNLA